ncbi:hypothetical protein E2P81_ATG02345 [Venturia nashicola]|nr:hypothetical protein E2P81_ATG02345 [Venturia nashicola]
MDSSPPVSNTQAESSQEAVEIINLINNGRKHLAEEGKITRGNCSYNGRSQPGTRNAGTRSKYYQTFKKTPLGYVSASKKVRSLYRPAASRTPYRHSGSSPHQQRCSPGGLDVIEEPQLQPPIPRSAKVWEGIVETHRQHLEREAKLAASGVVEKEEKKKKTTEMTVVGAGKSGKECSGETEGRESRFEDSSSSSEDEVVVMS